MLFFRRKPKAAKPLKISRKKPKRTAKPRAKKTIRKPKPKAAKSQEVLIGSVSHYFPHVKAGAVIIKKGPVAIGDMIHIKGHTTDFKQAVASLQIDRAPIEKGSKGDEVGILVKARVRINDKIYKVKAQKR